MVPRIFHLSRGAGCRNPIIRGPNWLGTICPGGPNFWGPFVHGDRICWGPFVQGDQFYGDRLSRGTGSWGPEVRGSNGLRTKCIEAFSFWYMILVYLALILQILVKKGGICWCCHKLGWWWGMVKAMNLGKATILLQRYIPTHQHPHPNTQPKSHAYSLPMAEGVV